ncbi:hypothetical protein C8R44DRAFT_179095 [Mycena epipterygia]|nr:hypothetical protein C8R44DRAFT_179095 [Mycena epipterygia]
MSHSGLYPQHFLLLIENSSELAPFWPDLRDCYLPRIVKQLSGSHPVHLTNIYISESRPAPQDFHNSVTRQYSSLEAGLKAFQFNYEPGNILSTTQIQTGIEFLSSSTTSEGRHLIVVAATTPAGFGNGHPLHDPWHELAKMLTQGDISLHLALTSNLRSGPLSRLFEQTTKWQQITEEPLWLATYSTAFIFRVSGQTHSALVPETKPEAPPSNCRNTQARRDTNPDVYTTKSLDDTSSESPSLVSQLQQFHGLTKKKVYGTKPARVPFVKDERVRERYRGAPAPPSFPIAPETGAPPLLTGRRSRRSSPKADRGFTSRHDRIADPYAPPETQWHQPMYSEGECSDQSSYSSNPSLPPSPVAQMSVEENYAYGFPTGQGMLPTVPWGQTPNTPDNTHPTLYPSFPSARLLSQYTPSNNDTCELPASQTPSFHRDPFALSFHSPPFETVPTASTSPPFLPPPLSPTAYIPQPPNADFDVTRADLGFPATHFQQPPFPNPTHIHPSAPVPQGTAALADPGAQRDFRVASPLQIIQPMPIVPPISAPALQDRVEVLCAAATSHNVARRASTSARGAPSATASSRSADALGVSSSSLTGWAG